MNQGIKETMDIIKLVTIIGVLIGEKESGNGLQLTDIFKLFQSEEDRLRIAEAFEGPTIVPAELSDLGVNERLEISLASIEAFRKILNTFRSQS